MFVKDGQFEKCKLRCRSLGARKLAVGLLRARTLSAGLHSVLPSKITHFNKMAAGLVSLRFRRKKIYCLARQALGTDHHRLRS